MSTETVLAVGLLFIDRQCAMRCSESPKGNFIFISTCRAERIRVSLVVLSAFQAVLGSKDKLYLEDCFPKVNECYKRCIMIPAKVEPLYLFV
jgi:hypothetical protein